jgi:hypothetical protein
MTPDPAKNIISSGTCFIVHLDVSQVLHKPLVMQQFRLELRCKNQSFRTLRSKIFYQAGGERSELYPFNSAPFFDPLNKNFS